MIFLATIVDGLTNGLGPRTYRLTTPPQSASKPPPTHANQTRGVTRVRGATIGEDVVKNVYHVTRCFALTTAFASHASGSDLRLFKVLLLLFFYFRSI